MKWNELQSPIAVVAHDAGAANLIMAWLDAYPMEALRFSLSGPALRRFSSRFPSLKSQPLVSVLSGAAVLVSGTSGPASDLEHQARQMARGLGVPSIGVLDHWVNYVARFERNGSQCLPDELWVVDPQALSIARTCFSNTSIVEQPNHYLEGICREVARRKREASPQRRILYVLEPMRSDWGRPDEGSGEFQALAHFISSWATLGLRTADTLVRLRPHPSDDPARYASWIEHQRAAGYQVELDPSTELVDALAWSDWVVGCESYALVIALTCGRRVHTSLPPWAPPCRLPHAELLPLTIGAS